MSSKLLFLQAYFSLSCLNVCWPQSLHIYSLTLVLLHINFAVGVIYGTIKTFQSLIELFRLTTGVFWNVESTFSRYFYQHDLRFDLCRQDFFNQLADRWDGQEEPVGLTRLSWTESRWGDWVDSVNQPKARLNQPKLFPNDLPNQYTSIIRQRTWLMIGNAVYTNNKIFFCVLLDWWA